MIKTDFIDRLKATIDIVDVVGSMIELQKAGASYRACCPFHTEKTPSFSVSPQRQTYKCFGCGQAGDAIDFVMAYKRLSYPEAIQFLAGYYDLLLEYEPSNRPKSRFYGLKLR